MGDDSNSDTLFSVSRSLWERVTPGLRGVSYLTTETSLRVRWFYADPPDEWVRELVSFAETECIADFGPAKVVTYSAEHLPVEEALTVAWEQGEQWVFLRYEPDTEADRAEGGGSSSSA